MSRRIGQTVQVRDKLSRRVTDHKPVSHKAQPFDLSQRLSRREGPLFGHHPQQFDERPLTLAIDHIIHVGISHHSLGEYRRVRSPHNDRRVNALLEQGDGLLHTVVVVRHGRDPDTIGRKSNDALHVCLGRAVRIKPQVEHSDSVPLFFCHCGEIAYPKGRIAIGHTIPFRRYEGQTHLPSLIARRVSTNYYIRIRRRRIILRRVKIGLWEPSQPCACKSSGPLGESGGHTRD